MPRPNLEILDRIGGGDSFASGLIYGLLTGRGPQWAVECGAAHGALAMTTPGDTSMATRCGGRARDAGRDGEGVEMTRESIAERIIEIGILPVVRAASGAEAIAVGRRARRGRHPRARDHDDRPGRREA